MVCQRCIIAVDTLLKKNNYTVNHIELGEAELVEDIVKDDMLYLNKQLNHLGFELIDDRKAQLVEKIKNLLIKLVHHSEHPLNINLSAYIAHQLNYEYNYLSNLFSEITGSTIEKFYISQKIEHIKELLIYDELSLSEIAFRMGYSSAAYLSTQFKKATGLTPKYFKTIKTNKRRNIEDL